MTTTQEVKVPDIGNYSDVEIIEVAVKPGSEVKKEDTLITLETEKASMDVPSPMTGKIHELKVKVGDKVSKGDVIALIEVQKEGEKKKEKETPEIKAEEKIEKKEKTEEKLPPKEEKKPQVDLAQKEIVTQFVHAGPATRRMARELGVDLSKVSGSGLKGRITTKDVQDFVKSILQSGAQGARIAIEAPPQIDFSQFGEIEIKPLNRIKKWTAKNLHRNWITIPHVTQFEQADITELETFRQENKEAAAANGIKLTPLAFIMKACVSALKAYPQFNASLGVNGEDLIYKKFFHIGVAVDTPNGLVVPVVREVDLKGLFDLARELGELSALAREGKLKEKQMQGSCFSISSLGGVGGTAFTPIINAPDVAILGVSKAEIKAVYQNKQFVPRLMLPLSLSYDHRVIDGAEAARFAAHIAEQLQDIRKLLL